MHRERSAALAWWAAATIFVSALLLFQVQPIISKKILPWFGGSPAVWTTALLFFQTALLAGYAYAHVLMRLVPLARQPVVHMFLLVVALLTLPITPSDWWKPTDGSLPALRILRLLLVEVGPPYFILSATGPLVQAWFAQAYPSHSPYRLYALSNFGSLLALLSYPFFFEIALPVNTQGVLWSFGFVLFAGLIAILGLGVWKLADDQRVRAESISELPESIRPAFEDLIAPDPSPPVWLMIGWMLLAALGTAALMAITNHVCQDISVDPFMWVVPLSLYLLSLIICFDSPRWYIRKFWGPVTIVGILVLAGLENRAATDEWFSWGTKWLGVLNPYLAKTRFTSGIQFPVTFSGLMDPVFRGIGWCIDGVNAGWAWVIQLTNGNFGADWKAEKLWFIRTTAEYDDSLIAQAVAFVCVLFLICMVCHGELAKSKPSPKHLTMYFLLISAGGALGGLFVAIICPLIFRTYFELALTICCGFVVAWLAIGNDGRESWLKDRSLLQWAAAFAVVGTTLLVIKGNYKDVSPDTIAVRNFYGVLSVTKTDQADPYEAGIQLYHGRILHGFQFRVPIQVGKEVLYQPLGASEPMRLMATEVKDGMVTLRGEDGEEYHKRLGDWSLSLATEETHERELVPNTYYLPNCGVGIAAESYPRTPSEGMKVAVIGLGTGTMVTHGKTGDFYRFYDIDPKVLDISEKYFTYRAKAPATKDVVLGDARIRMEREEPQNYDLIVLDAFSGDAIPSHLLTDEAFAQYVRHVRKSADGKVQGIIAVHISNRYLNLQPVVAALSRKYNIPAKAFHLEEGENGGGNADTGSDWILLTSNEEFWKKPAVAAAAANLDVKRDQELLWTDQRSSLWPILERE